MSDAHAHVPLSLRIARLLLVGAAAAALGSAIYIARASGQPSAAAPWLLLFVLVAAAFVASAARLEPDPRRGRLLALGAALALAALGLLTGFGAGNVTLPAAGLGVLAAWAAFLHPPRRVSCFAFIAYLVIGVVVAAPFLAGVGAFPWLIATVLIWPGQLLLLASFLAIYGLLAAAVAVLATAVPLRDAIARTPGLGSLGGTRRALMAAFVVVLVVVAFVAWAHARPQTSARFELDPTMLGLVTAGGVLVALGLLAPRGPRATSGAALGFGAALLFITFTARPAVVCERQGVSTGVPFSWYLTGTGGMSSSGSGSSSAGVGSGISTGEVRSGDRVFRYRCQGDQLVEFRVERQ